MSGTEDDAHREWAVADLDVYLCMSCRALEARRKYESTPLVHACGGAWLRIEDPTARRAVMRVLTNQLFKAPRA